LFGQRSPRIIRQDQVPDHVTAAEVEAWSGIVNNLLAEEGLLLEPAENLRKIDIVEDLNVGER